MQRLRHLAAPMAVAVLLSADLAAAAAPTRARGSAATPGLQANWMQAVAEASRLRDAGKIAEAADVLRKARKVAPGMPAIHVLQLIQYLIEQVAESPALARADAARLLDEACAVSDELIKAKQEVRLAMMAKSLALKFQAERVEQSAERKTSVMAKSDRVGEEARWVNADGSLVPKTVEDEWREVQGAEFVSPGAKPRDNGAAYEKFVTAHPDFAPARIALAKHYQARASEIKDRSSKSVQTRSRYLELASTHFKRAGDTAKDKSDAAAALDGLIGTLEAENLNRPAEAEALARSAVAKYPDQPMLVSRLLNILLPTAAIAATDDARRRAREAIPATAEARHLLGVFLWDLAYRTREPLPRAAVANLLSEALTALDTALKLKPEYVEAIIYKAIVLRLQAERVEQDPARAKALVAEADRLGELAKKLRSGK